MPLICKICGLEQFVRKEDQICLDCLIKGLEKRVSYLEEKNK